MDVRDFIAAQAAEFSQSLRDWLSIPSVSADPAHQGDVRKSAQWLVDYLKKAGFPQAEVWETQGLPAVYAHWPAEDASAPRVLVYGHHDVQPAALGDGWDYEPFAPYEKDGRIFGRGASDDKGQVLFHALGVRAALAVGGTQAPPVTLTLLIEGEEESGSPHFARLLEQRKDELRSDVIVISDTTMWAADTPSICTGMRGLVDAEITVTGPTRDLHSGSFGGGVPNPAHVLAGLLAGLHDENGHITLPGFYDDVVPLSEQERALLAKLPFDAEGWLRDAGDSGAVYGEAGFTTLERIWARPTAEVNGLWGGHTGPGHKTIIPKAAHAKLSFRLVADQEPAKVVESLKKYLEASSPNGVVVSVTAGTGVRPCRSAIDSPAVAAARRAMERAFGNEVLFTKEGGSGPEADLADILGAPLVFVAVGLDADQIHAPNEYVDLSRLLRGAESIAYLWEELANGIAGDPVSGAAGIDQLADGPLGRLALSRSGVDRATDRRGDIGWLEAAWADPRTRVLVVHDARALVRTREGQLELVFVSPSDAPEGTRLLLGVDPEGVAYFGVSGAVEREPGNRSDSSEAEPMALRQAGALLSDRDAGLMTHAVALAYWHDTHTHCPRCGAATVPALAGHITTCPVDGTEHFPRLDPAVIMLVIDPDDRLMLARNALWPKGRMSVVAGFVEPGESGEHAVAREVYEETSIVVDEVRYLGSQPWPMPRSLMLGYEARAAGGQQIQVDEDEIGEARWFSRAELRGAIEAGELGIAPSSSIARRLIEYWYGEELPDGPAGWSPPGR